MKKASPLILAAVLSTGALVFASAWLPPSGGSSAPAEAFRPFDGLRAVPSGVEGRLKPEATSSVKRDPEQQAVYLDPGKPLDDRVDDLLRQLTLAEKISLLGTTAPATERLQIPAMNGWNQSLHGIVSTEPP